VAVREGVIQEPVGRSGILCDHPWYAKRCGEASLQERDTFGGRAIDQILVIHVQQVEEEWRERNRSALPLDVDATGEPAPRDLERMGPSVGPKCDRLAVKDRRVEPETRHLLDDLRDPIGHVGEGAREGAHVPRRHVDLKAHAIELPLDLRWMDPRQSVGGV